MIHTIRKVRARIRGHRKRYRVSFDALESRRLLTVTVPEIETGLDELGAVVNQSVAAVKLLAEVPFLGGLSSALTGGAPTIQSAVDSVIADFNKTGQASEPVQTFLTANPSFTSPDGTVKISNPTPVGSSAFQFTIGVTPKPSTLSVSASGNQSFGIFNHLDLGSFSFSVSNQVQLQAVVQIDSSGDLLLERSSQTSITDTPAISLSKQLTVSGTIPGGGGSIQVTGFIGSASGLSLSPQFTISFGTTNDFVGLSQLLASASPSVSQDFTVNIPFGVGLSLNPSGGSGAGLPSLVYQKTYQFNPLNGSLTPSTGEILAGGGVLAQENDGQGFDIDTGAIAGAVLHAIGGPIFDKYDSYFPQDVSNFLLGNTLIGNTPLKTYLFGETPLDLASLACTIYGGPEAGAMLEGLKEILELGQFGSMLDGLNPTASSQEISDSESDLQETENDTGIEFNILDDPVGTVLGILEGKTVNLVTWNIDLSNLVLRAVTSALLGTDDPDVIRTEEAVLKAAGLLKPNPANPAQLEVVIGNPIALAQKLLDQLEPVANQYGLGKVLSTLDSVLGQISNLGLNFSFLAYGGATLGVNSSFLTDPTAQGILSSFFISATGMNGPGTFGNLLHIEMHASLNIDLPQDLTGGADVASSSEALALNGITPDISCCGGGGGGIVGAVSSFVPPVSAGNGKLLVGNVTVGGDRWRRGRRLHRQRLARLRCSSRQRHNRHRFGRASLDGVARSTRRPTESRRGGRKRRHDLRHRRPRAWGQRRKRGSRCLRPR
jgi:hypothetical protein